MDKPNALYTTKDRYVCLNCNEVYKSIKGLEMVVDSSGLPVVVCKICHHQVPVLKIEKHTPLSKKELLDRIHAHEKFLKGE